MPQQPLLRRALAEEYRRAGRTQDAVAQLDALGENLLNAGERDGAIQAIEAIIALNPPNQASYKYPLFSDQAEFLIRLRKCQPVERDGMLRSFILSNDLSRYSLYRHQYDRRKG